MMKIPSIEQIRECEKYTMEHKPITSIELMEIAARACVYQIKKMSKESMQFAPQKTTIAVFCGMGNNGGDGLAVARLLCESGYNCTPYIVKHREEYSQECLHQIKLLEERNIPIMMVEKEDTRLLKSQTNFIIDAMLGIGLSKEIDHPLLKSVIRLINRSKAFVFAIDTPSGLLDSRESMQNIGAAEDSIVEADFTLTFQFPKLHFLFPETYKYVGEWETANIQLDYKFLNNFDINNNLINPYAIKVINRKRGKFSNKGDFGHGLLIAGSYGMMGSAVLAAKAALRTGIGLLTANVPKIGYNIMQSTVNEALCRCDEHEEHFTGIPFSELEKYNAVAIGCGIGTHPDTAQGLKKLIGDYGGTLIIDADAINILAENKTWLEFVPPNSIFTPHHKEFERLTRKAIDSYDRLELQREFSIRYNCMVVLKGAHTSISTPQGNVFFNTSGNPGLATGGSGDVLTGMLLALIAQGYTASQAAITGVYLHGIAADKCLKRQSYESLLPSDVIESIGAGFKGIV